MDRIYIEDRLVEFFGAFGLDGWLCPHFAEAVADVLLNGVSPREAVAATAERHSFKSLMSFYGALQAWLRPVYYNGEYYSLKWCAMRDAWGISEARPTAFGVVGAVAQTIRELAI